MLSFSPKKPFCIFPKHPSLSKESHNIFYSQQTTLLLIAEKMRPSFETSLNFFFSFPPLNFPWEERITYALDYTFLHLFARSFFLSERPDHLVKSFFILFPTSSHPVSPVSSHKHTFKKKMKRNKQKTTKVLTSPTSNHITYYFSLNIKFSPNPSLALSLSLLFFPWFLPKFLPFIIIY